MVENTAPRFKYYQADLTFGQKKFEGITPAVSNDTDGIDCNDKFIALPWSRTSTVAVFPAYDFKRFESNLPLIQGHKGNVNDVQFSHFNPNLMATASEDGMIKLWLIPDEGIKSNLAESDGDLAGHTKKVTGLRWHRTADNLIASHSADSTVRVWDVMNQAAAITWSDEENAQPATAMRWSPLGDKLAVMKKQGGLIQYDPRKLDAISRSTAHLGAKSQKCAWIDNDTLFTSGFDKSAVREYAIWDLRNLSDPVSRGPLGDGLGIAHLYYDEQHNLMHVAGRGEMNISMFEVDKSSSGQGCKLITNWVGPTPQKGFMMMEKPCLDVSRHEVNRGCRIANNGFIEFVSFRLPNRTGAFQPELYPPFHSNEASMTCEEWLGGANKPPITLKLEEKKAEVSQSKKNAFASKLGGKAATTAAVDNSGEITALKDEIASLKAELEKAKSAQPVAAAAAEEKLDMTTKVTLGYWDSRARAAPHRYVLHYSGVEFEDFMYGPSARAKKDANAWFAEKANMGMDLPNMPYLIDGDFKLSEGDAIMHYICSKWNPKLLGRTVAERARVVQLASYMNDLRQKAYGPAYGEPHTLDSFEPAFAPFNALMDILKKNGGQFLCGSEVTYVDFYFFEMSCWLLSILEEKTGSAELKAYHDRMTSLPGFKEVWENDDKCMKKPFQASFAWIGDQ